MNSISEMSWEIAKSMLGEALNLKGGSSELKGPCPNCGGEDRFWIRQGHKYPVLFGCRAGCDYPTIIKSLANRGLVAHELWSIDKIDTYKRESPVPYHLVLWSNIVLDIVAAEGCSDEEDIQTLKTAANNLARAERRGVLGD